MATMALLVGEYLKDLRLARGLSFRKVAQAVGISYNNISSYEKGAMQPSFDNAVKLCRFFEVPLEYLLYGPGSEQKYRDMELVELFGKVDALPAAYRRMVKGYARKVLRNAEEKELLAKKAVDQST